MSVDALHELAHLEEERKHHARYYQPGSAQDAAVAAWHRMLLVSPYREFKSRREEVAPAHTHAPALQHPLDFGAVVQTFEELGSQLQTAFEQITSALDAALAAAAPLVIATGTVQTAALEERVNRLERQIAQLSAELAKLRGPRSTIPISTFAPDPYELLKPIPVAIASSDDTFTAGFYDANIHAAGDTDEEAFRNLKSLILDAFDDLSREPLHRLGPEPRRQLAVLQSFIARRPT